MLAREVLDTTRGIETELFDLSRLTAEYGRVIYPCKACVSTAMPLCHWPCSCYPNHSLAQVRDWMDEIYPMWVAAHGILIVTPVHWYQAPSVLKQLDYLVGPDAFKRGLRRFLAAHPMAGVEPDFHQPGRFPPLNI